MISLIRTHLKLARDSLKRTRARSFLTCLGIAIGVASIILILSLMGSITNLVKNEVDAVGADLIVVRPETKKDLTTSIVEELTASNQYLKSSLTLTDVNAIKKVAGVTAVAPIATFVNSVVVDEEHTIDSVTILGSTSDFAKIQQVSMSAGAFIGGNLQDNTVVVGHNLAMQLFGTAMPVGKTLQFMGQRFIVVGVMSEISDPINFNNVNLDMAIVANAQYLAKLDGALQIQQINVKVAETDKIGETAENIEKELTKQKSGDVNFAVAYGDQITHPAGSLLTIVTGILTLVAGISLVVGGIGVMNIMLVSVSERSHEVGIRKAVGASGRSIFFQFLFESLILCLLGGMMGLVLAYILAFFICLVTPFNPFISWQIVAVTFGTSVAVGLVFGLYPAMKAARKSPIDSLKTYQ